MTTADPMFEMVMMGLRLKQGMDLALFEETFGTDFLDVYGQLVEPQTKKGLLKIENGRCFATERGFEILNSILVDLMPV